MAPMYDEDEDIWTGSGLSRDIANRRLAEKNAKPASPSGTDRTLGAVKGAMSGASLGSSFGPVGTAIGGLLGGAAGAFTASPSETPPNLQEAKQIPGIAGMVKKGYDEFKMPGVTKALKETAENPNTADLSDFDYGY